MDIVIGCVDTRKARAAIAKCTEDWSEVDYWVDLGNNSASGQFVLGEPLNRRNRRHKLRLRTVSELFPEIIQGDLDGDDLPSCSAVEALDRQEPFVIPTLAHHALALLARLFRYGTISTPAQERQSSKSLAVANLLQSFPGLRGIGTDYPASRKRSWPSRPDILIMLRVNSLRVA